MQFCELSMPPIHLHNRARKEPCLPLLCERMVGMQNFIYCFVHTLSANVYLSLKGVPFWPKLHV